MAADTGQKAAISAKGALLFQGGVGVLGLLAILVLSIPVQFAAPGLWSSLLLGVIGAVLTYGALLLMTRVPCLFPRNLMRQMRDLHHFASSYSPGVLILLSLLAGVGEELLFRGAIQGGLQTQIGSWPSVLAASVLFGLVHYLSFTYFLIATGLGLIFGAAYLLAESLMLVMVWHAAYDMLALFCLLRFPHWFGISRIKAGASRSS